MISIYSSFPYYALWVGTFYSSIKLLENANSIGSRSNLIDPYLWFIFLNFGALPNVLHYINKTF